MVLSVRDEQSARNDFTVGRPLYLFGLPEYESDLTLFMDNLGSGPELLGR